MDTRKTTLIATVVIIALLAVGIGYAYTAYSQNGDNHTHKAYITLTQTGESGYTFADHVKIDFDTYNEIDTQHIYYRLAERNDLTLDTTEYIVSVLGEITLQADWVGVSNPPAKLNVYVPGSTGFDATDDWNYFVTSVPVDKEISTIYAYKNTDISETEWTEGTQLQINYNQNQSKYDPVTVCVCYGYKASLETVPQDSPIKFVPSINDYKELVNATILFKAVSVANVTYNANNQVEPAQTKVVEVESGTNYSLLTQPPEGFTIPQGKHLKGWNTDKNATEVLSGTQKIKEDVTYYAIWENNA